MLQTCAYYLSDDFLSATTLTNNNMKIGLPLLLAEGEEFICNLRRAQTKLQQCSEDLLGCHQESASVVLSDMINRVVDNMSAFIYDSALMFHRYKYKSFQSY